MHKIDARKYKSSEASQVVLGQEVNQELLVDLVTWTKQLADFGVVTWMEDVACFSLVDSKSVSTRVESDMIFLGVGVLNCLNEVDSLFHSLFSLSDELVCVTYRHRLA